MVATPRLIVGLPLAEVAPTLARHRRDGLAATAIAAAGEGDDARFALVLAPRPDGREQTVVGDLSPTRAAPVALQQARRGFSPVLLAVTGRGRSTRVVIVFEPADASRPRHLVVAPAFRDARGLFVEHVLSAQERADGIVEAVALHGEPEREDGADAGVLAIVARQPADAANPRIVWGVHLDRVAGAVWSARPEMGTLAGLARPVAIARLGSDGAWMASVWHDDRLAPWPDPDPLAPRALAVDLALDEVAVVEAAAARAAEEERHPVAIAAHASGGRMLHDVVYGEPGRWTPLPRVWSVGGAVATAPEPALDRWMRATMARGGARHGQLIVVRGDRTVWARACTLAEEGYPAARLDQPMRLGSVTKALTAMAWLAALRARPLPAGLDTPIVAPQLLDLEVAPSTRLARVTLRHLLLHDAGLRSSRHLRPDQEGDALAEVHVAEVVGRRGAPARAGDLQAAVRLLDDGALFARDPGGAGRRDFVYSNEGFILLGELLSRLVTGRFDRYGEALAGALGLDPADVARGVLLAGGREAAALRGESPAHPAVPSWVGARFAAGGAVGGAEVDPASYAYNGAFLGGAAGLSLSARAMARLLAGLGPRPGAATLLTRDELETLATPADDSAGAPAHGVHLGGHGWWSRCTGVGPLTSDPVVRLVHNGRLDGAASLLIHQMPKHAAADGADTTLGVHVAFNALFPLEPDPHGRELLAILQELERAPGGIAGDVTAPGWPPTAPAPGPRRW